MISYCWSQQEEVKKIHGGLKRHGYEIWLDINHMAVSGAGDGILEAMAAGVDSADVLVVCVSRQYSQSANCRLEAEYAHKRGKKLIFVMLQKDFTNPSGWLGLLLGTKLWYNGFEGTEEQRLKTLVDAIQSRSSTHTAGGGRQKPAPLQRAKSVGSI